MIKYPGRPGGYGGGWYPRPCVCRKALGLRGCSSGWVAYRGEKLTCLPRWWRRYYQNRPRGGYGR